MHVAPATSPFLALPPSASGRLAAAFTASFLVVLALNLGVAIAGEQSGFLVFLTALTGLGAIVGAILAAVAIVRRGERSILEFASVAVALLVVAFLVVELVVGH